MPDEDAGKYLSDSIVQLMGKLDVPLGLKALGYSREGDNYFICIFFYIFFVF